MDIEPENSISPIIPTSDDLEADIAAAQAVLRKAAEKLGPKGDEAQFYLMAMSDTIGVLAKTTRRWEKATSEVIGPHDVFPEGERNRLVREVVSAVSEIGTTEIRKRAERMIRTFDRRTTTLIGGLIGSAFLAGLLVASGYFWATGHGPWSANSAWGALAQYNPDPRPALDKSEVKATPDGRHYRVVSFWIDPPKAPPESSQ